MVCGPQKRFSCSAYCRVLLAVSVITTSGCSSLSPVAEFGRNASAVAAYQEVANDYPEILKREQTYGQKGSSVSDDNIRERTSDAERLRQAQHVLEAYARALGGLAAADVINYDAQIDALNRSLVAAKFASSAETEGYAKAAKLTSKLVTDAYRRHKIAQLVVTYNPSIQKASAALIKIIEAYLASLHDEQVMFDQLVAGRATRATRETPGESELLATYADEHRQLLQSKEANARALIRGIQGFANGHNALAKNKSDFNETVAVARKYADELSGVIAAFKS